MLMAELLKIPQSAFVKSFEIAIQLGAIGAVIFLYGKKLLTDKALFYSVIVGFLPTALIGFLLYPFIKSYLLGSISVVLASLFIGGIAMILFEYFYKKETRLHSENISIKHALLIGLFQSVAIIPGVSRAGATILGGLFLGISREAIVRFSFLLAIPTMVVATGYDLLREANNFSYENLIVLMVGFFTAFITALGAIQFFMRIIKTHSFISFGIYRVGIVITLFFFLYVWI